MKAISLHQPWATLIITGFKQFETRSWQTDYRGPLAIHAAKAVLPVYHDLVKKEPFKSALQSLSFDGLLAMPTGAILGTVTLADIFPVEDVVDSLSHDEWSFGDYTPGRFAWLLKDPTPFLPPIPHRGLQGLFTIKDDLIPQPPKKPAAAELPFTDKGNLSYPGR